MEDSKFLTLLGFCRKSGKLVTGTEKVTFLVKGGKNCLVMLADDISEKTEKELKFFSKKGRAVIIRVPFNTEEVSHAIGTVAGVVATSDDGFLKAILDCLNKSQGGKDE